MSSITVQSRTLSPSPSPGIAPVVLLDPVATTLTVAELIQQVVARQIAALQQQQVIKRAEASRAIERHYVTAEDLAAQAKPGTIDFPTPQAEYDDQASDEISTAVRRAWRAFEQRAYLIVIDGTIARSLEEAISCPQDRTVTFLRLVLLVGG